MDIRIYINHLLIIMSGTFLGQLVNYASYPMISRLYTAEDFGVFSIILSTSAVLGALTCFRFDILIQSCSDVLKESMFSLSILINVAFSLLVMMVLLVLNYISDDTVPLFFVFSIVFITFLTGFTNSSTQYCLKTENYKLYSQSTFFRSLLTAVPQVLLFYFIPSFKGLVIGFLLGYAFQSLFLFSYIYFKLKFKFISDFVKLKLILFKNFKKQLVDILSQLISLISIHCLNFLLLYLYTSEDVGYYSLGFRLASVPLLLISAAFSNVFFQKASNSFNKTGLFGNEFMFNLKWSSLFSLIIFIPVLFFIEPLIIFYLGKSWIFSGEIIIAILPFLAIKFIYSSVGSTPLVIKKPKLLLIYNFMLFTGIMISFFLAIKQNLDIISFLTIYTYISLLVTIIFLSYLFCLVRMKFMNKVV
jgi:O-antigen/teichoic acid export membrane protein